MNPKEYKTLLDRMEPDEGLEQRLAKHVREHKQEPIRVKRNRPAFIAAGLTAVMGLGVVLSLTWNETNRPVVTSAVRPQADGPAPAVKEDPNAVTIPEMKLPETSGAQADMIGLIVYQGKIYTQTGTKITPETAKQLLGEKLGRSTAGIDEWSEASDYKELASTIGEMDVYSVKGYDKEFRIMSYLELDGQIYAEVYEHLNGITVAKGEDLVGKLNLKGRVVSAKWQDFDAWNMGGDKFHSLGPDSVLEQFINALYEAKPVEEGGLYEAGIYQSEGSNQKFLHLTLEDGTEVELRLFKEGNYVIYGFAPVFLQLEPEAFSALWERM
ncbi:hypothetical protein [Paenibacillus sp. DMB20]|uniref:hypothetical protein n=1 Tax=Paenibacillus sp. DMB20 TaxID=1642570 RepID=UPI000627AD48|nr:hypothetical protein [Paenibacillus sp. DMB20]KKO52870.1 hypothetical protein XI25_16740 [Paenibacillus sp. DMB20]